MVDEDHDHESNESTEDNLKSRFPEIPLHADAPSPPKIEVQLPPHPKVKEAGSDSRQMGKMAIASTAASAFVSPIIILSVAGWWLDQKMKTGPWLAFSGVVLGFVVGVVQLLRITNKLNE